MTTNSKKAAVTLGLGLAVFLLSARLILANADDLLIRNDGAVDLVVTSNGGVLAATNTAGNKPQDQKKQGESKPSEPTKTVSIVPPRTQSTIKISPPVNNGKKVEVVITTTKTPPALAPQPSQSPSQPALPGQSPAQAAVQPGASVTKTVNRVVAQGTGGQPVFSVKSEQANQLTLQQGGTQVTTSLPIQIDTLTRVLSVPAANGPARVAVLPTEAVQGVVNSGLLDNGIANQARVNLVNGQGGINYVISGQRSGELFGLIPVQTPVQVELSAQTGKVVSSSVSPIFSLFGGFITPL